MVSSGALLRAKSVLWAQDLVRRLARRSPFGPERPIFGRRGLFPRLRRKSGLCYTADANSPFEAYIYVR